VVQAGATTERLGSGGTAHFVISKVCVTDDVIEPNDQRQLPRLLHLLPN